MRIVLWQDSPNHLQSAWIQALALRGDCTVSLVAQDDLSQRRLEMGWTVPQYHNLQLLVSPSAADIDRVLAEAGPEAVHIFSGTRAYPVIWQAFLRCVSTGARISILSEPGKWRGVKGTGRLLRSRLDALRYRKRVDFILAMGHMAVRWFRMSGYPRHKIYPFGYFLEKPIHCNPPDRGDDVTTVKLTYIGQCIYRKGVDLLLRALAEVAHPHWHLQVVGDGSERRNFEALSAQLGLSSRVTFSGSLKNEEAMGILERSDMLVLPSRWDGWGAVVNEALVRGVPVICSDHCGAADLLRNPARGAVVPVGSVQGLHHALEQWIGKGPVSVEQRQSIRDWSKCIAGDAAAQYVTEVIASSISQSARPDAPWLSA